MGGEGIKPESSQPYGKDEFCMGILLVLLTFEILWIMERVNFAYEYKCIFLLLLTCGKI